MWVHFALLFLAGATLVNAVVWKPKYTYEYAVRSQIVTGFHPSNQATGVVIKGNLKISVVSPEVLTVEFIDGQYVSLHKKLTEKDSFVLDENLNYISLPTTKEPIQVKLYNGEIDEILAEPSAKVYDVNMMKGILSHLQFQVDAKTENRFRNKNVQKTYTVKEQSVTGYCDTIYDVVSTNYDEIRKINLPTIVNRPEQEVYLKVSKHKDYQECSQVPDYHFSVTNTADKDLLQKYITKSSFTNMVASYDNKYFTILSSAMKNLIQVRPKVNDMENSEVFNMINITLINMREIAPNVVVSPNVVSAGNLTYVYRDLHTFPHWDLVGMSENSKEAGVWYGTKNQGEFTTLLENTESDSSESNSREHKRFTRAHSDFTKIKRNKQMFPDNLINKATILINDIATEITTPEEIQEKHTLEKYTILVEIFRYMNETSIATVENKIRAKYMPVRDEKKTIAWKIFCDAVTQAGTMPAFRTIRTLITGKIIKDVDAARLIGQFPRVMIRPTIEFIQKFYEFIDNPEVKNQVFVNTTAPYAFSEILRYAVWDQKYFYRSPNGKSIIKEEDKKKIINTYIPYLANELAKAYKKKSVSGIQTYVVALANTGHSDVMKVFKPYLEGTKNITTFQRMTMVSALTRIRNHEFVRPILYKIYQNENEHYEVRVRAVEVMFRNFPPRYILQRMAERTRDEPNRQVKNAIITGINSLAKLNQQKYKTVAENARIAEKYVDPNHESNIRYSTNFVTDYVNEEKDFSAMFSVNTIGSETTFVPKYVNMIYERNSSHLSPPAFNSDVSASNIETLREIVKLLVGQTEQNERTTVDEIANKLKIVYNEEEPMEGNFRWTDRYGTYFFVFDKSTIHKAIYYVLQQKTTNKHNHYKEYAITAMNNWEFFVNSPTEIGLPISYRIKEPMMTFIKSKITVKGSVKPFDMYINTETDAIVSKKSRTIFSFMTHFDDMQYYAGTDIESQIRVPAKFDVHVNEKNHRITLKLEPLPNTNRAKLLQHNVVPYTGNIVYSKFEPVRSNKNTQQVIFGEIKRDTKQFGNIIITKETDSFKPKFENVQPPTEDDIFDRIMNTITSSPVHYRRYEIKNNYNPEEDNSLTIAINYNWFVRNEKVPESTDKLLKKMLHEAKQEKNNLRSFNTFGIDFQMPSNNINWNCDGSVIHFKEQPDNAIYRLQYIDCDIKQNSSYNLKICTRTEVSRTPFVCPYVNARFSKTEKVKTIIRYGETCEEGKEVDILVEAKQSEDVKKVAMNSEICNDSGKENKGNSFVNSEKIYKILNFMDDVTFSVKADPKEIEAATQSVMKLFVNGLHPDLSIDFKPLEENSASSTSKAINVNVKRRLNSETADVTLSYPPLIMRMPVDYSRFFTKEFFRNESPFFNGIKMKQKYCTLDKNGIRTFDDMAYSVEESGCLRTMFINPTKVKFQPNLDIISKLLSIPSEKNVAVLYRDIEDSMRQIIIIYQREIFNIKPSKNNKITLNGKEVVFEKSDGIALLEDPNIDIVKTSHNVYKITINPAEVVIWYNFRHVQIQVPDGYSDHVRGMCGIMSDDEPAEVMVPQGCILNQPEHMSHFYLINDDTCPKDDPVGKKKLNEMPECDLVRQYQQIEVISDEDEERYMYQPKDRTSMQCNTFRTDVNTDEEGMVCFSTRPIPACRVGCAYNDMTLKTIDYHCEPSSPEIEELRKRIEKGANPDLSTKSVTKSAVVEIPLRCYSMIY